MQERRIKTQETIRAVVQREGWFAGDIQVAFIADGEYNENYCVNHDGCCYVFRINHGTQLGLENQMEYEYRVLQTVAPSGVTPVPIRLIPKRTEFPRGALVMSYIAGVPFNYERDWRKAAGVFAAIHALPPAPDLIHQKNPIADIVAESTGLLNRHSPHPRERTGRLIREYARRISAIGETEDRQMAREGLSIVNSEVNCTNFISPVDDSSNVEPIPGGKTESAHREALAVAQGVKLVDWEKAVVSSRYQDLGHFLVPTTTLWKSPYRFDESTRRAFLEEYHRISGCTSSIDELDHRTRVLENTIILRALSWTYMAYYEYTQTDRALKNSDTFERICSYLDDAESFMKL